MGSLGLLAILPRREIPFFAWEFQRIDVLSKSVGRPTQSGVVGFSSWQSLGQEMRDEDEDT